MKVAILDDYQNTALSMSKRANITVITDHLVDADAVVERIRPFDLVCVNARARRLHLAETSLRYPGADRQRLHG
jgi:hypothetical protein